MTVKELIEKLQTMPPELHVYIFEDGDESPITEPTSLSVEKPEADQGWGRAPRPQRVVIQGG